jgi:hypothetical protein
MWTKITRLKYERDAERYASDPLAVNYLGLCAITMPVGRDRAGMAYTLVKRVRQ